MPSKKKKYNARFPAGRIKKIMQSDEEVGKVAQAVPIIISKTLELFVESLLEKSLRITNSRNAKTLSPSHMKQCIMAESRFDFLRELVKNIPDISVAEEIAHDNSPGPPSNDVPYDLSMPSTSSGISAQSSATFSSSASSSSSHSSPSLLSANGNNLRNGVQPPVQQKTALDHTVATALHRRNDVKRIFDRDCFYKDVNIIPPKIRRTDSEPAASLSLNLTSTTTLRRLQHQPKSVPCTSKETPQTPIIPAPIINVDICNKPIIKIDYSNLDLSDKDTIESTVRRRTTTTTTPLAGSSLHGTSESFVPRISPVINIDLSNFQTIVKEPVTKSKAPLELDEDYDNI